MGCQTNSKGSKPQIADSDIECKIIYLVPTVCTCITQLGGRAAYDCKHRDGTVTVTSRASTGRSCLQSPLRTAAYQAAAFWSKQGSMGPNF